MRITTLDIYGFGKLRDRQITLSEGINVIEGFNEAGKSTLMAFIRSIFFGFESRRNPHLRYEPIQGGRFGGAIEIEDDEGEKYRIERIFQQKVSGDVRVFLPNGEIQGEEYLPNLLGKMNEKTFNQIFSFGLTELQQIDSLQDEEINDFIYHAGTGAVNQILKMKQFLDQKQQDLFKSSGRKPEINTLINKLETTNQEIEEIKAKHVQHQSIVEEIRKLEEDLSSLENEIDTNKKRLDWLEKNQQYYNKYQRIKNIDEELEKYPKDFHFPNNGLDRLEAINEKIKEIEVEQEQLSKKKAEIEQDIKRLGYKDVLIEKDAQISDLRDELVTYKEGLRKKELLSADIENLENLIEENLGQLGSDFNEEKIMSVDFSLQDKQYIQELLAKLTEEHKRLDEVNKEIELTKNRLLQLKQTIKGLKMVQKEEVPDIDFDETYAKVKKDWDETKEKNWQLSNSIKQRDLFEEQIRTLNRKKKNNSRLLYLMDGLLLLPSAALAYLNYWVYGGMIFGFSILIFFILMLKKDKSPKSLIRSLKFNIRGLEREIEDVRQDLDMIERRAKNLLSPLGITEFNEVAMERLEEARNEFIENKQKQVGKNEKIEEYKQEYYDLEFAIEKLIQNDKEPLKERIISLQSELEKWLDSHYLSKDITPALIFESIAIFQKTKEQYKNRNKLSEELQSIEKEIEKYKEKVATFTEKYEMDVSGSIEEIVYQLVDELKRTQQNNGKIGQLKSRLEEINDQLEKLNKKLMVEEENVNELLAKAKVETKESFYNKAKEYQEYQALLDEKGQFLASIRNAFNEDEDYDKLMSSLDSWDSEHLNEEIENLRQKLKEDTNKIKEVSEEKGRLQSEIKKMEEDKSLSDLQQEYAKYQAELGNKVKEWASVSLAKKLLEKTMGVYETDKQPNVIQRASDYFREMTGDAYKKIIAPIGTTNIEVISKDNQQFLPQFLSRGTVEQLFLAMRFALVEEFSKQMTLPIILDDIFVNFDRKRLTYTLNMLKQLAETHQIILFTCHDHVGRLVEESISEVNQVALA